METILSPDQLTECARIYLFLSQEKTNFFVINCLLCNKDYSEWLNFYKHLNVQHLAKIQLDSQLEYQMDEKIQSENVCEKNLNVTNQIHINSPTEEYDLRNEYLEHKEENIKEKTLDQHIDYEMNEEFLEECLTDEYEDNEKISAKTLDAISEKLPKPLSTCFFRLHNTDSKIMLKFIELLRLHPCQWNHDNANFSHKDKRLDSTLNLTEQLNASFKLNLTPQSTRVSVLNLLRWFDQEYIRLLNCRQNNFQFVCSHSEYFEKLLEFLPHKHLKPMKCEDCSKRFKSEHLLMAHKHKYHNGQIPFRCRYCGHGFIHQSSHKMHENRHIKIHVWPCTRCLYQAASKSDYIKHLATHSPHQPHKCNICGLAYKTKTNLNVHLKSHSLPAYECEFCKKKFYEKYRYKRHIWLHEEQEMSNKSIDNFTCDICGRRFTSNRTLRKHQLVHIQENYKIENGEAKFNDFIVYYCDNCSLEFEHKEAYETHMNLKHNIKTK